MANVIRGVIAVVITVMMFKYLGAALIVAWAAYLTCRFVVQPIMMKTEYAARRTLNNVRSRAAYGR